MWKRGMGFKEALDFVRERRKGVWPNYAFQEQLERFEEELKEAGGAEKVKL